MKIKKVNELNKDFEQSINYNNENVQQLKSILSEVYGDDASFEEYWDRNGDRLLLEIYKVFDNDLFKIR